MKERCTLSADNQTKDLVKLTDGDIRFILWVLPQADVWTNEGMRYYQRSLDYTLLLGRLKARLPENNKPNKQET